MRFAETTHFLKRANFSNTKWEVVSQPVTLWNPGKIWQILFPQKLQIVLISINIPGLVFISHCFALLHWGYTWVKKTKTSESVAVMITGFMDLDMCKTIRVLASWWLQGKRVFILDGVNSHVFADSVKSSFT